MYELFIKNNVIGTNRIVETELKPSPELGFDVSALQEECGGYSFRDGLYRVHTKTSSADWANLIGKYFTDYTGRIVPFGHDWMGRIFAIDLKRKDCLLMFDPATAEVFELNQDLVSFHNEELISDRESILAEKSFLETSKHLKLTELEFDECIGFKTPLFLNGPDTLDNQEVTDMEVYWEFQCQIYLQIKDLPPGTKINSVKFE